MSVQTEQLPVERFEFHTADPAAAESVINDAYVGYRPRVIAAHWGFAKPGNFSAAYHELYGHAPRQTLRN